MPHDKAHGPVGRLVATGELLASGRRSRFGHCALRSWSSQDIAMGKADSDVTVQPEKMMHRLLLSCAYSALLTALGCSGAAPRSTPASAEVPAGASPSSLEPRTLGSSPHRASWEEFWSARNVIPPPPIEFLDSYDRSFRVDNLTGGLVTDAEAKDIAVAAVRRGVGDSWAASHFRYDIVNSDVFGPPGLNGTIDHMRKSRLAGVVAVECPPNTIDTLAVGVIGVPTEVRTLYPGIGLTEIVVVHLHRSTGVSCDQVNADGERQKMPSSPEGELTWQLDTGELRALPIAGAVWYQARGWSCHPGTRTVTGVLCGLVQP